MRRISAADERGFSLVELVTVTGLLLLVITTLVSLLTVLQRSEARQASRAHTNDLVRIAMERMTKEIRQTTSASDASASHLEISTFIQGVAETVIYDATGTTLNRTVDGVTLPLVTGLTSTSVFSYDPAASAPNTVKISLSVKPEFFTSDPNSVVELDSEVQLRN